MKNPLLLQNSEATVQAGFILGKLITKSKVRVLRFYGSLGAGKTTFIRGFVSAFENAHKAEVASPTFTLVNIYPTNPPIYHCDMYRLGEVKGNANFVDLPEEAEEALDPMYHKTKAYLLIEWAEYLNPEAIGEETLDISLKTCKNNHSLFMKAYGAESQDLISKWEEAFLLH